jgi:hypothetical protein
MSENRDEIGLLVNAFSIYEDHQPDENQPKQKETPSIPLTLYDALLAWMNGARLRLDYSHNL